jgi:hypothetical protein
VTEIARYEDRHLAVAPAPEPTYPTDPTGGRLVAWADGLAAAHRIGTALCQTAFVPAAFRGKPEECAAAILFGDEIGLTPTQALRSVYTVSGTPGLYARAMVALVLAAGHEVWTVSKSDASVTVAGRRRGSSHVIEETWTTARAAKAGYTNNKKYATDPAAMLYARAASDVCRQVAPDALAGLAYSVEELELSADEPTTTVRRSERKTTAKRSAPPAPPEPDAEPPAVTVERADEPRDGLVTRDQLTKIAAQMGDLGITDRDDALTYVAEVIGRPIESRNDLTASEASRLIDHMALALGEIPPTEDPS